MPAHFRFAVSIARTTTVQRRADAQKKLERIVDRGAPDASPAWIARALTSFFHPGGSMHRVFVRAVAMQGRPDA